MKFVRTSSGKVFEAMILSALKNGGYRCRKQVVIGARPGGALHRVDLLVTDTRSNKMIVSLKWQQSLGTAEQKVPFEVICLMDALKQNREFKKAYLVLGGDGWKLKEYFVSEEMSKYISYSPQVRILTTDRFIALANSTQL